MPVPLAAPFGRLAHERGSIRGVILSAAVHAALVFLALWSGSRLVERGGMPGPGRGRSGGGGGGARALLLFAPPAPRAAASAPPIPTPAQTPKPLALPVPVVQPPAIAPPPVSDSQLLGSLGQGAGNTSGAGPGTGGGSGGGAGTGKGLGTGPDSGGAGGRGRDPTPRQVILPPMDNRPAVVRGTKVTVRFEVSDRGEVMRVWLDPPPQDRGYAGKLREAMKSYRFNPATTPDGQRVAGVYSIVLTL